MLILVLGLKNLDSKAAEFGGDLRVLDEQYVVQQGTWYSHDSIPTVDRNGSRECSLWHKWGSQSILGITMKLCEDF